MARCVLYAKDLPTTSWDEVVYYANYLLNMIPTREVCHVTPIEKWCGKKTSIGHLRMFGCVSWAHILDDCKKKLDEKGHACIIMGYSKESKSYSLFDPIK